MLVNIKAKSLAKRYGSHTVFQNMEFSISTSKSLAVTGENGSGKSTLLEIIAGIQKPTSGELICEADGTEAGISCIQDHIGFSSPKINPYGELTALENLEFAFNSFISNSNNKKGFVERFNGLLNKFDLYNDRNKRLKYYSSGMKQRMRLIFAFLHNPHILILDEPTSNLDNNGKYAVYSLVESVKSQKIVIIAFNENEEAGICDSRINLEKTRF